MYSFVPCILHFTLRAHIVSFSKNMILMTVDYIKKSQKCNFRKVKKNMTHTNIG